MRDSKKILLTLGAAALIAMAGCTAGRGSGGSAEPVTTKPVETAAPTAEAVTPTATHTPTPAVTATKKPESEDNNLKKGTIEEAAYESFSSFIDQYYFKSKIEDYGVFKKLNFWDQAEIYEIVIDAYEHTGDERYLNMIRELFQGFTKLHGEDFSWNEYNDDIMWITIAFTRAYRDTGDKAFLDSAVRHFDLVWERGWSEDLGGGIFWRIENTTKNACINCPAAIAACLLAEETHDDSYYEKAVMIMDWVVENIYETKTGRVYDAYEMNGKKNPWASTYNQGTFIGANTLLYLHTGDGKYLSQARRASDYTIENMYDGKVMDNEANSGDLVGFKGILARWMYAFAVDCDQPDVMEWMKMNAEVGWSNRNSKGIAATTWNTKTSESSEIIPFSASTIVSALNNVNNECRTGFKAEKGIKATDFTRCGKVIVTKTDAVHVKADADNAFLEYSHVTFPDSCKKTVIKAKTEKPVKVEIRIGSPDGQLISTGTIEKSANGEFYETTLENEALNGTQKIYIVFPDGGSELDISMINFAS